MPHAAVEMDLGLRLPPDVRSKVRHLEIARGA
jgi:hypothetical protein